MGKGGEELVKRGGRIKKGRKNWKREAEELKKGRRGIGKRMMKT